MDPIVQQKIDKVKAARLPVFSLVMDGVTYIYRGINRREFRSIQSVMTGLAEEIRAKYTKKEDEAKMTTELSLLKEKSEEELVMLALISPEFANKADIESLPAGVVTRLADLITSASGFVDEPDAKPTQL